MEQKIINILGPYTYKYFEKPQKTVFFSGPPTKAFY